MEIRPVQSDAELELAVEVRNAARDRDRLALEDVRARERVLAEYFLRGPVPAG